MISQDSIVSSGIACVFYNAFSVAWIWQYKMYIRNVYQIWFYLNGANGMPCSRLANAASRKCTHTVQKMSIFREVMPQNQANVMLKWHFHAMKIVRETSVGIFAQMIPRQQNARREISAAFICSLFCLVRKMFRRLN